MKLRVSDVDFNDISLTRQNVEDIQDMIDRFHNIYINYKNKKNELASIKNNNNVDKSFFNFFSTKKNENNKNLYELEKNVNQLKKDKDDLYIQIRNIINKMISDNEENNLINGAYLDYKSLNIEVYNAYKPKLKLINKKNKIDNFFNDLEFKIKNNIKIDENDLEQLKNDYKKNMDFLKQIYFEDNQNNEFVEKIDFPSELNLDDVYAILSVISLVYSTIINPIFNNYKEQYDDYVHRAKFINKYENRINNITSNLLGLSKK